MWWGVATGLASLLSPVVCIKTPDTIAIVHREDSDSHRCVVEASKGVNNSNTVKAYWTPKIALENLNKSRNASLAACIVAGTNSSALAFKYQTLVIKWKDYCKDGLSSG